MLRLGDRALNAWLCLLSISMNLFVLQQIDLFGLTVTSTDAMAVGYVLGLNLIQEYFGRRAAIRHIILAVFINIFFLVLVHTNLLFIPAKCDVMRENFVTIFSHFPRVIVASLFSFGLIQLLDVKFFGYLKNFFKGKHLWIRGGLSLFMFHIIDTFVFSFLGLYGMVDHIWDVILFSLIVKLLIIPLNLPYLAFSKRFGPKSFCEGEFSTQMNLAKKIMKENQSVLKRLSE